nr:DUF418 domain-containing protein [Corynebacterium lactis]
MTDDGHIQTAQRRPRMLVPDAARGLALLGIAIANITTAWIITDPSVPASFFGGIGSSATETADKIAVVFTAIAAHNRGLPMFATLLGFGIGLITLSLSRRGFPLPRARVIVAKRYAYLALFGAVHAVFLFFGDVMFFYGLCGIVFALLLGLSNRTLTIIAWVPLGIVVALGAVLILLLALSSEPLAMDLGSANTLIDDSSYPDLVWSNLTALAVSILTLPIPTLFYFPVMLIGFVWARKGVLADVPSHRPLLIRWLVVALVVSFGIGLPWGLSAIGVLPPRLEADLMIINMILGVLTGPGILAGLALLLEPLQRRIHEGAAVPMWLAATVALGKRSMTGYLLQSVIFFVLVYPFMLDFPHGLGAAIQTGVAFAVWLATLLFAWALEAHGVQGPFEKIHRRLSYGPTMRPELASSQAR